MDVAHIYIVYNLAHWKSSNSIYRCGSGKRESGRQSNRHCQALEDRLQEGPCFKTPLLVTLLAKPDHVDHSLIYDGLRLDIGNGGIHDGSYDSPSPEDVLLNPTNDTQVRLNWIKIQGTTDQERHYNWTGKSDDGPVVKQVSNVLSGEGLMALTYSVP
jgi:hypothetical protein